MIQAFTWDFYRHAATILRRTAAGDSFWLTSTIRLFKNNLVPTIDTLLADMVVADYAGYAEQPLVDSAPAYSLNSADEFVISFPHASFQPSAAIDGGQLIYGWYLVGPMVSGGPLLMYVQRFDTSVILMDDRDIIVIEPRIAFAQPVEA